MQFTGEAHSDEDFEDDEEGDEEDDDEEEDDEDEDDDDEDESPTKGSKPRVTKTSTGGFASVPSSGAAGGEAQPECKQN